MHYKFLLTGSSGFVGTSLSSMLKLSSIPTLTIDINKPAQDSGLPFIQYDLTQSSLVVDFTVDTIIHLASNVGGILHNSLFNDLIAYNANIDKEVLRIYDLAKAKRLVFISTINVYEGQKIIDDSTPLQAIPENLTPYARSKYYSELSYLESIADVTILRPTNLFGKGQLKTHSNPGESHVIPDLMFKFSESSSIEVFGNGLQRRNFLHVRDFCSLIMAIISTSSKGLQAFNVRSDNLLTIGQLSLELASFMGIENPCLQFRVSYQALEKMHIYNFPMSSLRLYDWYPSISDLRVGLTL